MNSNKDIVVATQTLPGLKPCTFYLILAILKPWNFSKGWTIPVSVIFLYIYLPEKKDYAVDKPRRKLVLSTFCDSCPFTSFNSRFIFLNGQMAQYG